MVPQSWVAAGSGPDPPCNCRGISTDARDRIGKSPIEAIRIAPELWVSTTMESGLVSSHATADAAPRPFCTACWSGLQLGSRPGEWGLRFERLPELCACTLLPSSHRVRCPEHDMKLLTQGRGAQGGADCLPATRSAETWVSTSPAVGLVRYQSIPSQARALTRGSPTLVGCCGLRPGSALQLSRD